LLTGAKKYEELRKRASDSQKRLNWRYPARISRFAGDLNSFFSTYIHSAAPFFGIALRRDGR
jgi:hypothetical protein